MFIKAVVIIAGLIMYFGSTAAQTKPRNREHAISGFLLMERPRH